MEGMPSSEGDFAAIHPASGGAAGGRLAAADTAAAAAAAAAGKKKTTGPIHNPRYKSIMCDHWERSGGTCPYAEKCQFAHGPAELAKWQSHRARQQGGGAAPGGPQLAPPQQAAFVSPVKPLQQQPQTQYVVQYAPNGRITPMKEAYAQQPQQQQQVPGEYAPSAYYRYAPPPQQQQQMSFQPSQGYAYPSQQQQQQQQGYGGNKGLLAPQPSLARAPSPLYGEPGLYYPQSGGYHVQQQPQQPPARQQQQSSEPMFMQRPQQPQASRQTPAGSLSSTPPAASPFALAAPFGAAARPQSSSSRRSISPDTQQSLDVLSYPELLGDVPVPRSASDPRRTASLPQLFSKDFLNSLNGGGGGDGLAGYTPATTASGQSMAIQRGGSIMGGGGFGGGQSDAMRAVSGSSQMNGAGAGGAGYLRPSPSPPVYPTSRRGSAPPVVLSVVTNSIGDYNSLADLDSLADDLVSEPATSASQQLFSMPTVFPGSIRSASQASVSSSTSASAAQHQQRLQHQGNSINEYL